MRDVRLLHVDNGLINDSLLQGRPKKGSADANDRERARLSQDFLEANRIVEILPIMVNSADAIDEYQLTLHEVTKPIVQTFVFGEPAVPS